LAIEYQSFSIPRTATPVLDEFQTALWCRKWGSCIPAQKEDFPEWLSMKLNQFEIINA
jgi:hypothetical protein